MESSTSIQQPLKLNFLHDGIQCSICYHNFSYEFIPISLKCGHTICHKCLINNEKLANNDQEDDSENDEETAKLNDNQKLKICKCLICRKELNLMLKDLPINKSVLQLSVMTTCKSIRYLYCQDCHKILFKSDVMLTSVKCISDFHSIYSDKSISELIKSFKSYKNDLYNADTEIFKNKTKSVPEIQKILINEECLHGLLLSIISNKEGELSSNLKQTINKLVTDSVGMALDLNKSAYSNTNLEEVMRLKNDLENYRLLNTYYGESIKDTNFQTLKSAVTSSLVYSFQDFKYFQNTYSVSFNINQDEKSLILYSIQDNKISKINLPVYDGLEPLLNESITPVVNENGTKIYLFGGLFGELYDNETFFASSNVLEYDLNTKQFTKLQDLKYKRHCPCVIRCPYYCDDNLKIDYAYFVIGGTKDNGTQMKSTEKFVIHETQQISSCELTEYLPEGFTKGIACCVNWIIYYIGISEDDNTLISYEYTKSNAKWKIINIKFETYIHCFAFTALNNSELIIFGGLNNDMNDEDEVFSQAVYTIDLSTETIKESKSSFKGASFCSSIANYKYTLGGISNSCYEYEGYSSKHVYDVLNEKFTLFDINYDDLN